jgi:hypothetical protein
MIARALSSVAAACTLTACGWWGASATTASPVETTGAEVNVEAYPPDDIEGAPQVVYDGRPTYYYQSHWYYRDGAQWRSYRQEPSGLVQHRQTFEAQPNRREGSAPARVEQRPQQREQQRPQQEQQRQQRPQQRPQQQQHRR